MPEDARPVRDLQEVLAGLRDDDLTVGAVRMDGPDAVHLLGTISGEPPTVGALHASLWPASTPATSATWPTPGRPRPWCAAARRTAAYLLPATTVDRIRGVVDSGGRLPEKSTYFWPKPRTGMVFRLAF